jgi:hypothetical protein
MWNMCKLSTPISNIDDKNFNVMVMKCADQRNKNLKLMVMKCVKQRDKCAALTDMTLVRQLCKIIVPY